MGARGALYPARSGRGLGKGTGVLAGISCMGVPADGEEENAAAASVLAPRHSKLVHSMAWIWLATNRLPAAIASACAACGSGSSTPGRMTT